MAQLHNIPDGWSSDKLDAFNQLNDACEAYMIYDYALGKLSITDPVLVQDRADLGNLIKTVLGPALKNKG